MRVLHAIAGGEQGGAEEFFLRLSRSLASRDIEQQALIRPHEDRQAALRVAGIETSTAAFGGMLDMLSSGHFQHQIDSFRPNVVLTWMSRASRFCPRRVVNKHPFVHIGRLGGYYDLKYYRNCDHLIGNTADIVSHIEDQGWPAERAHYLPNFVVAGTAPARARAELGLPEVGRLLLALGRFHTNKAFDVLLKALRQLPDVVLCLAGSGPDNDSLRRQVADLGLGGRVALPGWQADVASLFAAADLFVCPSRIEPLGNVVIEAWAHQVPVVAASAKGPKALITDGENGLLFPIDDDDGLANAIKRVLKDRKLASRLASAGHVEFEARFSESIVVDQYLELFRRLTMRKDVA